MLIIRLYSILCRIWPGYQKSTRRRLYQLAGDITDTNWSFMNYGYAPLDQKAEKLELAESDEPNRYGIQLYHHVVSSVDLEGSTVLDVGSGRGGGTCYIRNYLKPRIVVGVDFSEKLMAFCNQTYCVERLFFAVGDAECLPFADSVFDAVVNVESSYSYASMDAFLTQVKRVLRPGGYFMWADMRKKDDVEVLYRQLRCSGLILIREADITPNVIAALDLNSELRTARIQRLALGLFVKPLRQFAGVKGSWIYRELRTGNLVYKSFVLQKPA